MAYLRWFGGAGRAGRRVIVSKESKGRLGRDFFPIGPMSRFTLEGQPEMGRLTKQGGKS